MYGVESGSKTNRQNDDAEKSDTQNGCLAEESCGKHGSQKAYLPPGTSENNPPAVAAMNEPR